MERQLDSRELRMPKYMVYCVFVSCIGSFANGWTIGCSNLPGMITHQCPTGSAHITNPAFPDCLPMETSLWGFAVSSFCVGGLFGGAFGGVIQTYLGRKKTIILNTAGWIIGGILLGTSVDVAMFIIGRILCGISCGLGSLTTPTYIGETSTIRARGAMGALNQMFIVIGILLSSVIGLPTSNVPLWRVNFAIVAIPAIAQAFLMVTCVESPRWLVSVGRLEEAQKALQRLRGNKAIIQDEFYEIVEGQVGETRAQELLHFDGNSVGNRSETVMEQKKMRQQEENQRRESIRRNSLRRDSSYARKNSLRGASELTAVEPHEEPVASDMNNREPMNVIEIFTDPTVRRMALIILTHHAIQQLSGMNAVMYYSSTIFASAFDEQMSKYLAIATAGVNFVVTFGAVILVDRMGRRALLMLAEAGACLFSVLLVVGYACHAPALLVVSVFLYVASFAIGIGPIPWLITSEMTPTYANSAVGAVATATNWAMNFLIGQIFPVIFAAIQGYSFVIFAAICFFAFLFTFFFLPESKNRSIENIVRGFERNDPAWRRPKSEHLHLDHHGDNAVGSTDANKDARPDAHHTAGDNNGLPPHDTAADAPAADTMKSTEAEPGPPWQSCAIKSNADNM